MKRKIFATTILVCCFIIVCFAAAGSIDGKWTGSLKTPDGNEFPLNYSLKTNDGKLTGTSESPEGTTEITAGKVVGNDFSFSVPFNGGSIGHSGKYYSAGDSVSLNIDFNGQKFHTTLKRADK